MNEKEPKKSKRKWAAPERNVGRELTKEEEEEYVRAMNEAWRKIAGKIEKPWFR